MPKGVPNKKCTGEFKRMVVEALRQFKVGGHHTIQRRERIYLEKGVEGLYVERRGQNSKGHPHPFSFSNGSLCGHRKRARKVEKIFSGFGMLVLRGDEKMQEQRNAVQQMQNYIEAHLAEPITPAHLARASHFSPWYAQRLFTKWTNLSPADYIRRLRLSRSALLLRDGHRKVADLALEMGFGSVDGYQRAFFREFGCNPKAYAQSPVPLYLFTPFGVQYYPPKKEKSMDNIRSVFIQTVEKPARKVLLKRGVKANDYFAYCEEVGCDVWGLLQSIPSISGEPVCLWLPATYITPGTSEYVQGVEVPLSYGGIVPEGFEAVEFPAAKYLLFQGEPFAEEDYCEAIDALQTAVKRYNPAAIGAQWDNTNPRIQLEPIGTRGYIELWPIK